MKDHISGVKDTIATAIPLKMYVNFFIIQFNIEKYIKYDAMKTQ